jgi:phosphatidylglycerol---prolipoprotein diacylglyceryl transferase
VFPELFRIGTFEVTSFSLLVAIAALVGIQIFSRELRRSMLPEAAVNAAVAGVVGGLVGAKLIWASEFARTASFGDLLLSRGGFSWFGGFVGGVSTGLWMLHRYRVPLLRGFAAAAPALAIGHAIGRIGCFLVGDDYGRPSDLPWAVAFPRGLPPTNIRVHPTQLYETLALGVLGWLLFRWRRRGMPDGVVLSRYLILAGGIRFCIEFIRINARIAGPLTLAQLWSLALIAIGIVLALRAREDAREPVAERRASVE